MAAGECHLGRHAEARAHTAEGLRLARKTGHWTAKMDVPCALAWVALAEGRNGEAGYLDCLEELGTTGPANSSKT